jgi:hypothetical protein
VEDNASSQSEREGDHVSEHRYAKRSTFEAVQIDFQARKEEQKRQPEECQDLNRQIDLDPTENGRPDDHAGNDFQHDRRHAQRGKKPTTSGASTAITATMRRLLNETSGILSCLVAMPNVSFVVAVTLTARGRRSLN